MAYVAVVHFGVICWPSYSSTISRIFNWKHLDNRICWFSNRFPVDVLKCLVYEKSDHFEFSDYCLEIKEKIQGILRSQTRLSAEIKRGLD